MSTTRLIDGVAKEKAMLRRQPEGHGIEDVNGVDAPIWHLMRMLRLLLVSLA